MRILVSGTIAYDIILDYPGKFSDHIDVNKIHSLSLSFPIPDVKKTFGGTAANISYNLAMIGVETEMVGSVSHKDKAELFERFKKMGIGMSYVQVSRNRSTSAAYIITDKTDSQITGFHPGAMEEPVRLPLSLQKCDWPIIAPENPKNMARLAKYYQKTGHKYIFDPGQAIAVLNKEQYKILSRGASIVIGNDYEIDYIQKKLGRKKFSAVVLRTLGPRGSEIIYPDGRRDKIGAVKVKKAIDPTGAGDAFRAGFIKGVISGYDLKRSAQLGATTASFAVEKRGTQHHTYSYRTVIARHNKSFVDKI